MDIISKNIIKYRKQAKLSQERLAERSDVSVGYLSKLERSVTDNVSVTVLMRIADALDVTLNDLAYRDNDSEAVRPEANCKQLNKMLDELYNKISEQLCQNIIDSIQLLKQ